MLVLSRKVGERIRIGGNITVVVNRIIGNRAVLGFEAPKEVEIVRGELDAKANPKKSQARPASGQVAEGPDSESRSV